MKLKEVREAYYEFSRKASDISRQLGFAGIALIWIFKVEVNNDESIPHSLVLAALLIVIGLVSDLLQYIYGTAAWGIYHRCEEKKKTRENTEIKAPPEINWPTNTFFAIKVICISFAYYFILSFLLIKFI